MISTIDQLLDQGPNEVQLQCFLDNDNLFEECYTENERLIDYLVQPETIDQLIRQLIYQSDSNNPRNIYVISELFASDFPRIQDALLECEHFSLFYSFLSSKNDEKTRILDRNDALIVPHFCRIITMLSIRRPMELLRNFKLQSTFVEDFRQHLDSTSIIDILHNLISNSGEQQSEVIRWYIDIQLIDALMEDLLKSDSVSIQMNIVNLLNEFLKIAFEQYVSPNDDDIHENGKHISSNQAISQDSSEKTSSVPECKLINLVEKIVSMKNLENLFDRIISKPSFATNFCDFLLLFVDLLDRHLPTPISIPIRTLCDEKLLTTMSSTSNNYSQNHHEQDDEKLPEFWKTTLTDYFQKTSNDPLTKIYLNFVQFLPRKLPSLINFLSQPSTPLIPSSGHDDHQTVKYQFISEPVGSGRLKLIRFFTKLIHLVGNDFSADRIYKILNEENFLNIIVDLFHQHIYNNFLHSQVYFIIQNIVEFNATALKKSDYLWTRTYVSKDQQNINENQESSAFLYVNRNLYRLFQGLFDSSKVNLIERLLDQYELNTASNRSLFTSSSDDECFTSALLNPRFTPPNSGHIVQILDCLREHASTFDNYLSFLCNHDHELTDDGISSSQLRWYAMLDILHDDEKKRNSMHNNEQFHTDYHPAAYIFKKISDSMNVFDHEQENQNDEELFLQSFPGASWLYTDDDDDDDNVNENTLTVPLESDRSSTNPFSTNEDYSTNDQTNLRKDIETMEKIERCSDETMILKRYNHENVLHITQLQSALSSISTNEIDGLDEEF